jgi:glyoxylase-like metal-dependent hydrolase (beta-lactamase superfamily II)
MDASRSTGSRHAWSEPGVQTVAPGVHRIPLPLPTDGLRAVNVYALEDGGDVVLVDGGWALEVSEQALEAGFGEIGRDLGQITRALVTHAHRDHYTQAIVLRRRFGTRVEMSAGERASVERVRSGAGNGMLEMSSRLRRAGAGELVEEMVTSAHDFDVVEFFEDADRWIDGVTEIPLASRTLRAIPTPGHTTGHLVFQDAAAGLLFAGDHVLPHITPSIGFEPVVAELPLQDYLDSLAAMLLLADCRLLPAHGPVQDSVHTRVHQLVAHHESRFQHCLDALGEGRSTAYEVAARLLWTRRDLSFEGLGAFNQMLATAETMAHLDVLARRGVVEVNDEAAVNSYARAPAPS